MILSGPGRNLHPITTNVPKVALPIGNRPMISYALDWCAKAGFSSVHVVADESDSQYVEEICRLSKVKPNFVALPNGTPTGAVLPLLKAQNVLKPHRDIVVLPCDFITDVDPESLISAVRLQSDDVAVSAFYYKNVLESLDTKTLARDVLFQAVNDGGRLLVDAYDRNAVKEAKVLKPRMAMLWRFPEVVVAMDHLRASIVFFRSSTLDFENIDFNKPLHKVVTSIARRTWRHRLLLEKVSVHVLPKDSFFMRANTLAAYTEANRHFLRLKARTMQSASAEERKKEPGQAAIGNDSIVGENTEIGERSSVKRTAIGDGCVIGRKCRLNGCVLLDGVVVLDDTTLENCIIGQGAVIETKSKLVGCTVEGKYIVAAGTEAKNEVLKGLSMASMSDDEFSDVYSDSSEEGTASEDEESDEEEDVDYGEDDIFDRS